MASKADTRKCSCCVSWQKLGREKRRKMLTRLWKKEQ